MKYLDTRVLILPLECYFTRVEAKLLRTLVEVEEIHGTIPMSQEDIAQFSDVGIGPVRTYLKRLEDIKVIKVRRCPSRGPSTYKVNCELLHEICSSDFEPYIRS